MHIKTIVAGACSMHKSIEDYATNFKKGNG